MPHEDGSQVREITVRRAEVLTLIERNFSQAQIADQLGIAPSTVHSHVGELEAIADCRSMGELARWWTANKRQSLSEMAKIAGIEDAS